MMNSTSHEDKMANGGATKQPIKKKILVLETNVKAIDLEKLQPEDRKKYYDDMAEKDKNTPLEVFINMYDMLEDEIKMNEIQSNSLNTVPELMLRQAITQSYFLYYRKQGIKPYTSFKMLINVPPSSEIILEPIIEEIVVKQDILRAKKGGGEEKEEKEEIKEKEEEKEEKEEIKEKEEEKEEKEGGKFDLPQNNGIKIRFEHRVQCRMPSGKPYVAVPGEEVTIIALIVRPVCSSLGLRERQSIESKIVSTGYDVSSLASDCKKYFGGPDDTLPEDVLAASVLSPNESAKKTILKLYGSARSENETKRLPKSIFPYSIPNGSSVIDFKSYNTDNMRNIMQSIMQYVNWFQNYYLGPIATFGALDRMAFAINMVVEEKKPSQQKAKIAKKSPIAKAIIGGNKMIDPNTALVQFYKNEVFGDVFPKFDKEKNAIVTAPIPEILKRKQITDLIAVIENITSANISLGNPIAMIDDMRRIGAYDVFMSAITRGPDSQATKIGIQNLKLEYAMRDSQMMSAMSLKDESSKAAAYLRIIEKNFGKKRKEKVLDDLRIIFVKKSGDILSVLTKREAEIVVRDFKTRDEFEKSVTENKCPHVLNLVRFRSSTTLQQMKDNYFTLKKFFKKGTGELPKDRRVILDERFFIKCSTCGFDILCPHIKELTEINTGANDSKTSNMIRDSMQRFLDNRDTKGNHFCSICAERIEGLNYYDTNAGDFDTEVFSSIKDELKTDMWKEITLIINTMHFGPSIKVSQIVSMSIAGIHEYIHEVENQLKLSRTNTADDIKNKKKLFIIMYSYAYLIHLIVTIGMRTGKSAAKNMTSGLSIGFVDYKGTAGNVSEYIKYAIIKIAKTKSSLIKSIPNITIDFIKNKIIDAYKLISTKGIEQITLTNENHYRLLLLDADPIYSYYYFATTMAANKMMSIKDKAANIQHIIGVPITKLDTIPSLFVRTNMLALRKSKNPHFRNVDGALNGIKQIKFLSASPAKEIRAAFADNFVLSYESFFEYVNILRDSGHKFPHRDLIHMFQSNISTRWSPLLNSTGEIYRSDSQLMGSVGVFDHIEGGRDENKEKKEENEKGREKKEERENNKKQISVNVPEKMKSYITKQIKLLSQRAILQEHYKVNYLLNVVSFYSSHNPYFVEQKIPLSSIYDEKGNTHKWSILVIEGGKIGGKKGDENKKEIKEITGDFALKELNNGKYLQYKLIDRKCETCGVLRKHTETLSESKIMVAREEKVKISNFFKYFHNKCPVESPNGNVMHEWGTSNICPKCKLNYSTLFRIYSKEAEEYYETYKKIFEEASAEIHSGDEKENIAIIPPKDFDSIEKVYLAWVFNYDLVIELSSALKINQYMLSSIGSMEGVDYKDIISGKYIPSEPETTTDARMYNICSYTRQLIIEYEQLRNFASTEKPNQNVLESIEKSGIESHLIPNLGNLLPPAPGNWQLLINYFEMKKKPRESITFALEIFVTVCLDIFRGNVSSLNKGIEAAEKGMLVAGMKKSVMKETKWNFATSSDQKIKKLRETFISTIITSILKDEEMKTKPGDVNWKKLRKDKSLAVEDIMANDAYGDPNVEQDISEQSQSDSVAGEKLQSEDKAFKNHFDIGDADQEEGVEVHTEDAGGAYALE